MSEMKNLTDEQLEKAAGGWTQYKHPDSYDSVSKGYVYAMRSDSTQGAYVHDVEVAVVHGKTSSITITYTSGTLNGSKYFGNTKSTCTSAWFKTTYNCDNPMYGNSFVFE